MQPGKISQRQFIGLMVVGIVSTGLVYVPASLIATSKRDAWLALFASALFGLALAWVIGTVRDHDPETTFVTWLTALLGAKLGKGLAFGYALFWFLTVITITLPGGMMIHVAYLPETPISVTIFALASLTGYAVYLGLEPLSRFNTFVLLAMLVTFISLGVINGPHLEVNRLLPLLDKGWDSLAAGVISPIGWFAQVALVFSLSPQVNGKTHRSALLWVVLISAISFEYLIIMILLAMGPSLPSLYEFPTLELPRIAFIGASIRGFDALIMTVWVTAVSVKGAIWLFAALNTVGELFQLKDQRHLIPFFVILISLFAFYGVDNISEMKYYGGKVWSQFSLATFEGGIPLLLLILSWRKRRHATKRIPKS